MLPQHTCVECTSFSKKKFLCVFPLEISLAFIWGTIYFCTMEGFFTILEKTSSGLICTRLYKSSSYISSRVKDWNWIQGLCQKRFWFHRRQHIAFDRVLHSLKLHNHIFSQANIVRLSWAAVVRLSNPKWAEDCVAQDLKQAWNIYGYA